MRHLILLTLALAALAAGLRDGVWHAPERPGPVHDLRLLAVPSQSGLLFAATRNEILLRKTGSAGWSTLERVMPEAAPLRQIGFFSDASGRFFAAGGNRILLGHTDLRTESVFSCPASQQALAFLPGYPEAWYAACSGSLYRSADEGRSWSRILSFSHPVTLARLAAVPSGICLMRPGSMVCAQDGHRFSEVFSLPEPEPEEDSEEPPSRLHDLVAHASSLYLAADSRILVTEDGGGSWRDFPLRGLPAAAVTHIRPLPGGMIVAAAAGGVYGFHPGERRWQSLYEGMTISEIRDIAVDRTQPPQLWALSPDGIQQFILPEFPAEVLSIPPEPDRTRLLFRLFSLEPPVDDVHRAVIRASNTGSGKIRRWHAASRAAALLPDISFGRDLDRSPNIDLDRGSTSDPDRYIFGPDEVSRGTSLNASWDLGDLLFGSSQTSIDGREKLMVELRHELLAEATRLYHERRRLQMETVFSPPLDTRSWLENLLRMDELSALLDGMTGGWFLDSVRSLYADFPELASLWHPPAGITDATAAFHVSPEAH